jgi:hypothetical protein
MDATEILRNIADIVDEDGNRSHGVLELLASIQADLRNAGIVPQAVIPVYNAGASAVTGQQIVFCPGASQIVVFDVFCSLNAAATVSFVDQDNNRLMASMIAPNNGQGFVRTSQRGIFLPPGKSLHYSCSAAITHSLDVSYAIVPTEA